MIAQSAQMHEQRARGAVKGRMGSGYPLIPCAPGQAVVGVPLPRAAPSVLWRGSPPRKWARTPAICGAPPSIPSGRDRKRGSPRHPDRGTRSRAVIRPATGVGDVEWDWSRGQVRGSELLPPPSRPWHVSLQAPFWRENLPASVHELEDACRAYERVAHAIDAVNTAGLSPQNLDLMAALSVVIGVAPGLLRYRDRMLKLPEFDIRHVDLLTDYATATWYLHVTNFAEPSDARGLEDQVAPLRAKLLVWAAPLAHSGIFSQAAVDQIREGSGIRDAAGDLVALTALYREHWNQVRGICGVTEEELDLAARLGSAVYSIASRRENAPASPSEAALRVRKAWTLTDRAYSQCRRALAFLRYDENDVDILCPSLRRNAGHRRGTRVQAVGTGESEPGHTDKEEAVADSGATK